MRGGAGSCGLKGDPCAAADGRSARRLRGPGAVPGRPVLPDGRGAGGRSEAAGGRTGAPQAEAAGGSDPQPERGRRGRAPGRGREVVRGYAIPLAPMELRQCWLAPGVPYADKSPGPALLPCFADIDKHCSDPLLAFSSPG